MPWPTVSLAEVCEFRYGKALPSSIRVSGNVRVFGSNGAVGTHDTSLTTGPTIVVGRKGSVGEVHLSPEGCWPIDTTYFVDSTATSADIRWLAHRLGGLGLTGMNKAAAVPGLNREDAYRLELLLPPIEEQRRIADILDRADALGAKRREALVLLDDLTQSIFRDMFGNEDWPRSQLRLLATKITKGTTPTSVGLTFEESGVPFLRVMDLVGGLAVPSSRTLHIGEASHKVLARSRISGGEVLISIAGTIGRIATVPAGLPEMNCNQAVAIVALGSHVELDYLAAWLRGPDAGRQMGSGSVTATIANLSLKEVGDLLVPIPPRELQRTFADRASMVRHNRLTCESLVAGQKALFTSLQQRAFAGQL